MAPLNRAAGYFAEAGLPVLASRDWHPQVTTHFREYGGAWPPHCIQGTPGAAFHPGLRLPPATLIISKGTDPTRESYSAFDGHSHHGPLLEVCLARLGVRHLYLGGLATDYCIRATALDTVRAGLAVTVLSDAIAGVDVNPGDSRQALAEIAGVGVLFCTVGDLKA